MDGHWSLPAGAHDGNESFIEGALRELKEETGLHASVGDCRLLHVQQVFGSSNGGWASTLGSTSSVVCPALQRDKQGETKRQSR